MEEGDAVYPTKKGIYLIEAIVGTVNRHKLSKKNTKNESFLRTIVNA